MYNIYITIYIYIYIHIIFKYIDIILICLPYKYLLSPGIITWTLCEDQLTELRKKETAAKHSFEMVSQSLADEVKFAKAALEKAKKRLGPHVLCVYIYICVYI